MIIGRNSDNELEGQIDVRLSVGAMSGANFVQAMTDVRQCRKPSPPVCLAGDG